MGFLIFIVWVLFCAGVGQLATRKGYSGILWLLLAVFLTPLVGLVLMCLGDNHAKIEKNLINSGSNKKCPYCAEIIKAEARTCRYCGKDLYEEPTYRMPTPVVVAIPRIVPQARIATIPPIPSPSRVQKVFKVAKDGQEFGDLDAKEIQHLLASNDLSLDDYYLDASSNSWVALRENPQLNLA